MGETARPDASLVIEFENTRYVADGEAIRVARELTRQAVETPYEVEVVIPADAPIADDTFAPLTVRRFDVPAGRHYYEVKTAGARAARSDVVVFADIDVAPVGGWLTSLIKALDDDAVEIAVGNTVIRPLDSVAAKTFAAGSWFPAQPDEVRGQVFANNLAVRVERFLPDGFPPIGCRYRGPCRELNQEWARNGVRVLSVPEALSYHPAPVYPIRRAVWDGHDQYLQYAHRPFLLGLAHVSLHQLIVGSKRLFVHRSDVGLRWREMPAAVAYNIREALARVVGFTMARLAHRSFHRWFTA